MCVYAAPWFQQNGYDQEVRSYLGNRRSVSLSVCLSLCAVLCCAVLCCAVLCCAVLCCAVLCKHSFVRGSLFFTSHRLHSMCRKVHRFYQSAHIISIFHHIISHQMNVRCCGSKYRSKKSYS